MLSTLFDLQSLFWHIRTDGRSKFQPRYDNKGCVMILILLFPLIGRAFIYWSSAKRVNRSRSRNRLGS